SLVRQRQLLSSIAAGRSLDELAARISTEIGHDCRVLPPTRRHLRPGPGGLLVIEGDHTLWSRDHVEAVQELCAIAALDRARRDEGRRALRPLVADALALVESGAPHVEVAARLRQAGSHSERPMVVAVAELRDDGPSEVALSLLEDVALTVGPAVVGPGRGGLLGGFRPFVPG